MTMPILTLTFKVPKSVSNYLKLEEEWFREEDEVHRVKETQSSRQWNGKEGEEPVSRYLRYA